MQESGSRLTRQQIDRLGNMSIFLAKNTYEPSKTKILKLVYLCEEWFVKKFASPFIGLPFHAWQFGPVQKELYVNLGVPELEEGTSILANYIKPIDFGNKHFQISPLSEFNDDEFSDDEIAIMEQVASNYKYSEAKDLVFITHKLTSLWYKTVIRENGLIERFDKSIQKTSELQLDFSELLESNKAKEFYLEQVEMLSFSNSLK